MCGIAGIIGAQRESDVIERMTRRLAHRGPDDSGTWSDSYARLGHTRLSILDLSDAGHQPMVLGPLALTYNGEVYNYRELRRDLAGTFRSDCDTEVILHLFARDGERCVESLTGMFAFAIWDSRERRLFAARDRLGIKPFYYRELEGGGIAFASEIKALLELGRPGIDATALRDYFTYKYAPAPKTIYRGIRQLPPGHTLTWDERGGLRLSRYWKPQPSTAVADMGEATERLDALLRVICPEHTLSDVPVGVFLSGGIDSTTMVAYLERPKTFTLGTDVRRKDESAAARAAAEHFGTDHHEEVASSIDLDEALETVPEVYDEPFGDSGAWASYMVSRMAVRHVTVALSGEGGDELFLGYNSHSKYFTDRPGPLQSVMAALLPPFTNGARSAQRRSAEGLEKYAAFLGPFTTRQKRSLLAPDLLETGYDDLWHLREFWDEGLEPLKRLQWLHIHTDLPGDLLAKVDRASMAHSLEVRPPLLDHRLVEFALSVDPRLLRDVEANRGKLIVRRLLEDRVPPGHFDSKKRGFNLPIRSWVRRAPEKLRAAVDRLDHAGIIRRPGYARFSGEQAWSLLVLERWMTRVGAL